MSEEEREMCHAAKAAALQLISNSEKMAMTIKVGTGGCVVRIPELPLSVCSGSHHTVTVICCLFTWTLLISLLGPLSQPHCLQ
jgi:hypothetical protein